MKVVFAREAKAEMRRALDYYESVSPLQRQRFLHDLKKATSLISIWPKSSRRIFGDFRRCLLSRFPYYLAYIPFEDKIRVFAIGHCKQRPFYWKKRYLMPSGPEPI